MNTGFNWFSQEALLLVQPTMAEAIGLHEAIFLHRLDYWLQRRPHVRDDRNWVYNTYEEWHNQISFLSVRTLKRVVSNLRKKELIETTDCYNGRAADRTLWYTINYEIVQKTCGIPESANLSLSEVEKEGQSVTFQGDKPSANLELSEVATCPPGPSKVSTSHAGRASADTLDSANHSRSSIDTLITTTIPTKKETTTREGDKDVVVVVALSAYGLSRPIVLGFAKRYPEEYLYEKMAFLEFEKIRRPDLANPAGWLRRAIEEDFAPPPGYQTPEQQAAADHREVEMFMAQHQEYDAIREQQQAKVAARFAQQLAILQPRYGTTESLLTAWVEGREYVTNVFSPGNILQFLDQTVLLSFANRRAQIGVWDQVALNQLELRGKQIIKETLAYAMRDVLDGGTGTYELVLVSAV